MDLNKVLLLGDYKLATIHRKINRKYTIPGSDDI